jgi:hypothetical protein
VRFQSFQHTHHAQPRQRGVHLDLQRLARAAVPSSSAFGTAVRWRRRRLAAKIFGDFPGLVARAIVDDDHFTHKRESDNTLHHPCESSLLVLGRDHHGKRKRWRDRAHCLELTTLGFIRNRCCSQSRQAQMASTPEFSVLRKSPITIRRPFRGQNFGIPETPCSV